MTTAPALAQQTWIEEEVRKCHEDTEMGLWSSRQSKQSGSVRILIRRWKHLNEVLGTPTADTYLAAGSIGGVVALAIMVALGAAAYSRLGVGGFGVGAGAGLVVGLLIAYNQFITMIFRETYIEVIVNEYQSAFQATHEALDVVIAFLPRLGFILRPEVFEGNRGETGFRDKHARIRLRTNFGFSIHDLRTAKDFYGLPADEESLDQGANMERYSIETLVRASGHLYRLYGVPKAAEDNISKLAGIWHWLLLIAAFVTAVILVAD